MLFQLCINLIQEQEGISHCPIAGRWRQAGESCQHGRHSEFESFDEVAQGSLIVWRCMLEKHGSRIWGRVGDREHLITANEPGVEESLYPRDLYVENEEDKLL